MSNTTYDFGFTFEDPTETVVHVREPYNPNDDIGASDLKDEIMAKLYDLEARLLTVDQSTLISEHKRLVEMEVSEKLKQVEDLILPLMYNLMKNPEKEYIHWPNRTPIIDNQIEKITAITRYYERV
jgi:hypothetical protein